VVGNVLVMVAVTLDVSSTPAPTPVPPAGWTPFPGSTGGLLRDHDTWDYSSNYDLKLFAWTKVATGSEPSSYAVTQATDYAAYWIGNYTGVDASNPVMLGWTTYIDNAGASTATNGMTSAASAVAPTRNGSQVVLLSVDSGPGTTNLSISGSTPTFANQITSPYVLAVCDGNMATAGFTGDKTFTNNNTSAASSWITAMFVLNSTAAPVSGVLLRSSSGVPFASSAFANPSVPRPSGVVAGDVLLMTATTLNTAGTAPTPVPPVGWVPLPGSTGGLVQDHPRWSFTVGWDLALFAWTKVATSSEPSSYAVTQASAFAAYWIGAYTGVDNATPVPTTGGWTGNLDNQTLSVGATNGMNATALSVTTARPNSGVVLLSVDQGRRKNSFSAPGTPALAGEIPNPWVLEVCDGQLATAGATGNKAFTPNNIDVYDNWACALVALNAAPVTGGGGGGPTLTLRERWSTRRLVGDQAHVQIVRLRPGHMNRAYQNTNRIDTGQRVMPPLVWKGNNGAPWQGNWVADGPWVVLPNVEATKWSISFDVQSGGDQGSGVATIVMDNIGFPEATGVSGLYHVISRGYYAPQRGVVPRGRANVWPLDHGNTWKNVLDAGWQVEIWEGYGTGTDVELKTTLDSHHSYAPDSGALDRTFTGIVIDCEVESFPDKITLTVQDFGIFLTDQRIIGSNKPQEIRSPITFADHHAVLGEVTIRGPFQMSTGHMNEQGQWKSTGVSPQWIQIDLPPGFYEDFWVSPMDGSMTMYVSMYMRGTGNVMDRLTSIPAGWVTLTGTGTGTTPDGNPYMFMVQNLAASPAKRWYLGHNFQIGPSGARLRLTFTPHGYLNGFLAYRFGTDPAKGSLHLKRGEGKGWVLIDDTADMVRAVLIWAGFKEWNVEDLQWGLKTLMHYGESKYFIDVITDVLGAASYIFYVGPPSNDDRSIGKPHMEHIHAVDSFSQPVLEVRDTDMVEALTVKTDLTNLPIRLRYRGIINKGGTVDPSSQDTSPRVEAVYFPPWSGEFYIPVGGDEFGSVGGAVQFGAAAMVRRTAGISRWFTETMASGIYTALTSWEECLYACVLAAMQYALGMRTGQFQIPGMSRLKLNDTISVIEESTATNSRMWVTSIASEHVNGGADQQGHWTMTISGSLVDHADMAALLFDLNWAYQAAQRHRSAWSGLGLTTQ
jgi:hypothetical protein